MPWYESSEKGVKFLPGVWQIHLSNTVKAFYGAEDFYVFMKMYISKLKI